MLGYSSEKSVFYAKQHEIGLQNNVNKPRKHSQILHRVMEHTIITCRPIDCHCLGSKYTRINIAMVPDGVSGNISEGRTAYP